jgi:hypothetical protein
MQMIFRIGTILARPPGNTGLCASQTILIYRRVRWIRILATVLIAVIEVQVVNRLLFILEFKVQNF